MAIELVMPKLGLTMQEGQIISWHKNEGDVLNKGDALLEIQTEKLTNIIESPSDGVLLKILAQPGDSLPIAAVLAYIGKHGEDLSAISALPAAPSPSPNRVKASPAARALSKKLGIDYTRLAGTGPGGRIVKKDVAEAVGSASATAKTPESRACPAMPPSASRTPDSVARSVPYAGMRKAIGEAMSSSWTTAPMVTHHARADVTELLALRSKFNDGIESDAEKLSVTDLFAKITAKAIRCHPFIGATLSGNEIIVPDGVNIGVAVAIDKGLVVPVVKDADRKDIFAISAEIKELTAKARGGTLDSNDMTNGTFTISNIGGYDSVDFFTPIIHRPESSILGICRTHEAPVVKNGEIVIRSLMGLSLTFDHRVIDGAPAAKFLGLLLRYIENPIRAIFAQ